MLHFDYKLTKPEMNSEQKKTLLTFAREHNLAIDATEQSLITHLIGVQNNSFIYRQGKGTALHRAASLNRLDIVNIILNIDIDINLVNHKTGTVLYKAAQYGNFAIVKALIAAKADVNQVPKHWFHQGITPLYKAAQNGYTAIVELLLANGAKVNLARSNGKTPLYVAAQNGYTAIVKLLLANGAKVNQVDLHKKTPLHIAVTNGHFDIVEALIKAKTDLNKTNESGKTPLYIAAQYGHTEIVKALIVAKANINQTPTHGTQNKKTPLFIAAQYGHTDIVEILIKAKANINKTNIDNITPLWKAVYLGHAATAQILINNKAAINKVPACGFYHNMTPLHMAAQEGYTEIVKALITAKADVNLLDIYGKSPLHKAAQYGHKAIIKLLLNKGANLNQRDKNGRTALDIAEQNGYLATITELIKAQENINLANHSNKKTYTNTAALSKAKISNVTVALAGKILNNIALAKIIQKILQQKHNYHLHSKAIVSKLINAQLTVMSKPTTTPKLNSEALVDMLIFVQKYIMQETFFILENFNDLSKKIPEKLKLQIETKFLGKNNYYYLHLSKTRVQQSLIPTKTRQSLLQNKIHKQPTIVLDNDLTNSDVENFSSAQLAKCRALGVVSAKIAQMKLKLPSVKTLSINVKLYHCNKYFVRIRNNFMPPQRDGPHLI